MKTPKPIVFLAWTLLFGTLVATSPSALKRVQCADDLFVDGPATFIEIDLKPDAVASLRQHPRRDVTAVVGIGGIGFATATVHLKGSGTFQPIDEKSSFTVKFAATENSVRFSGVTELHLNNSADDATFVQEKLGSELFAMAGIAVPRVAHARVKLNGRDKGLYVLKEGFTTCKAEMNPLLDAAAEPELGVRWHKLSQLIDLDEFFSFMAMEVLICHWDGYALANHNFRACVNRSSGKIEFLPGGMDQLFGNPAYPLHPDMTGTLARALIETPEGEERFENKLKELSVCIEKRPWAQRAREILEGLRCAVSVSQFAEMRDNLEDLSSRVTARQSYIKRELLDFTSL